nr:glycosyltransferase [Roseospira visakhapatnamensis]
MLVGANLDEGVRSGLATQAPPGVVVEPARPDFRALLERARLSVSQAGYNTVAETLMARVPAVLVPWGEGDESEQRDRAAAVARLGRAQVLDATALTPATLARAIDTALTALPAHLPSSPVALRGVARSVDILLGSSRARLPPGGR